MSYSHKILWPAMLNEFDQAMLIGNLYWNTELQLHSEALNTICTNLRCIIIAWHQWSYNFVIAVGYSTAIEYRLAWKQVAHRLPVCGSTGCGQFSAPRHCIWLGQKMLLWFVSALGNLSVNLVEGWSKRNDDGSLCDAVVSFCKFPTTDLLFLAFTFALALIGFALSSRL